MNHSEVKKCVGYMLINFSINLGYDKDDAEQKLDAYCKLLVSRLEANGVTEDMFKSAVAKFVDVTEGSNYNKLPSVGDLLSILGMKPKGVEQIAKEQCELVFGVLSEASRLRTCMFADRVTNYVLKTYAGGMKQMAWDFSNSNPNKKEVTWGRKDFVERYVTATDIGKESVEGHYLSGTVGLKMYGGDQACLENANQHKQNVKMLESKKELPQIGTKFKENV